MLHKITGLTIIVLILFALTTSCSNPNQQTKSPQWTAENVPYGTDKQQTFNILLPKEKNNVHAIIYIHGGFYYSGDKSWYPLFLKEYSGDNIFVTMDYRLIQSENNTVHIQDMTSDVHNALLKIREISEESGVLIKDFILAGHSAGAHLALLYGYKYFEENINNGIDIAACIGLSGPADYTDDLGWSSMTYYGEDLQKKIGGIIMDGYGIDGIYYKSYTG